METRVPIHFTTTDLKDTNLTIHDNIVNVFTTLSTEGAKKLASELNNYILIHGDNENTDCAMNDEFVDLGLSIKWARCNVGAKTETEYGDYLTFDEAQNALSKPLRLPMKDEFKELCTLENEWVENYNGSEVNGCLFYGKGTGEGNTLFIPAAGNCYCGSRCNIGDNGYLWSSEDNSCDHNFAWNLLVGDGLVRLDSNYRQLRYSVRGVASL